MPIFQTNLRGLSDADFEIIREMARAACGISLHEGKRALVSSRLEKLVHRNGFDSFTGYLNFLSGRKHGAEFTEFIDTLTTNHTGFWREPEHFIFLQQKIALAHRAGIRIWSAACATGEEPYTIAMCLLESGVSNARIEASDISRTALKAAIEGAYESSRLSDLPAGWRDRYFQPAYSRATMRSVAGPVRALVEFSPVNLLEPFRYLGQFDVIFCRNVMIYFDQPVRDSLVEQLGRQLTPGGYLFTGHSETLLKLPSSLEYVQPATYRKA
jgi:chemotaxis protein methyltransferase CheR